MARGGAERIVLTLADGARERGHDVALASRVGPLTAEFSGPLFSVPEIDRRANRVPSASWSISRTIRVWRPDIVHAHNPGMAVAVSLATLRGRRPTSLVSVHGLPPDDYRAGARVLRMAGLPVIACGREVGDRLRQHRCRVLAVVENAVTPPPPPADRAALEREWALPPNRPFIVSVGRLVEQKNHRLAVAAIDHVPGAVLAIIGEGPLKEVIASEAHASGVSDRIRLVGARADARAIIGAADVLVLSSAWEGLPLVVLEAMAAGTPVVATAAIGLREALGSDAEAAILVEPDNERGLGEALARVTTDPVLRARLSETGRAVAAGRSHQEMVQRFMAIYEHLGR